MSASASATGRIFEQRLQRQLGPFVSLAGCLPGTDNFVRPKNASFCGCFLAVFSFGMLRIYYTCIVL